MSTEPILTEAEILAEVVEPNHATLSPQLAEELLSLHFNEKATNQIRDLLQKNSIGSITPVEKATLEKYLRVGEFLDLMQAKARLTLHQDGADGR